MNYQKIYDSLVQKAKSENRKRRKGTYYEMHHIIPCCMGGNDKKENLVLLTAREHFICHWLLVRIYPKNSKLIHAFFTMCNYRSPNQERYIPSSRTYEEAKKLFSEREISQEIRDNISKGNTGKKRTEEQLVNYRGKRDLSEETREGMKQRGRERRHTQEEKDKIGNSHRGQKYTPYSEETLANVRRLAAERVVSEETKKKQSDASLGKPKTPEHRQKIIETKRKCKKCSIMIENRNFFKHYNKCNGV